MNRESNVPVLVGTGVVQQRLDDSELAADAASLMSAAIDIAARDAGSRFLVPAAEVILIPRGTWPYSDPTPLILPRHGAIRSVVSDIGVLQQSLISRACDLVSRGAAEIVIVCGGEAKYRTLHGQISGAPARERDAETEATERMIPDGEVITRAEIERGLSVPNRQYALIDTALRRVQGLTREAHIELLGQLWSRFSDVAAANPDAWLRRHTEPSVFTEPSLPNPLLAWPYTKLHCSQWNVDQAAALIICNVSAAQRFGIARDRWVFAHVGVQSNLMIPLTHRAELHRAPAVACADVALREHSRLSVRDIEHRDLYSCFPAAVRVQQAEFGLALGQSATVTGGMTFGGGPFNSYSIHSLAKIVAVLRANPNDRGVITNVSGMLTKFGLSAWSCQPPATPYASIDVSTATAAATPTVALDAAYAGRAKTLSYTVAYDRTGPTHGIAIGSTSTGANCLVTTTDASVMDDMLTNDWCDREITVNGSLLIA